jgi:hypothetical protein
VLKLISTVPNKAINAVLVFLFIFSFYPYNDLQVHSPIVYRDALLYLRTTFLNALTIFLQA